MSELFLTNPQVDPTDLWRNLFWLRDRIEKLEQQVAALQEATAPPPGPPGPPRPKRPSRPTIDPAHDRCPTGWRIDPAHERRPSGRPIDPAHDRRGS